MKQQPRTLWHHVRGLVDQDEVYLTAPSDGKAIHWRNDGYTPNEPGFRALLDELEHVPRFYVAEELIDLVQEDSFQRSMLDMKQAGVLRLPFPAMMVEFKLNTKYETTAHAMVLLRDMKHDGFFPWEEHPDGKAHLPWFENADVPGGDADFYGLRMSLEHDVDGFYLTVSPSTIVIGVHGNKAGADDEPYDNKGTPWLKMGGESNGLMKVTSKLNALVKETYLKDAGNVFYAASAAYLLMASAGVEKEVIQCEKLNKKRRTDGKPTIPQHTYVYIKHVYRSASGDASDEYIPRKSPRPHWRRGHLRNVRFGEGRLQSKPKFIPGRIVAFQGDTEPNRPSYIIQE